MNLQEDLYEAIRSGNKSKILALLRKDVKLNILRATFDEIHNTALHLAFESVESSEAQLIEILDVFLNLGLDINVKNRLGKTILQLAVERRMKYVIDFCLSRKADPNIKHESWISIAHFVIEEEYRNLEIDRYGEEEEKKGADFVDWMLSRRFDFYYKKNEIGYSALYWANKLQLKHIVLILLKRANNLPEIEKNHTPLLSAFFQNNLNSNDNSRYVYDIVKLILEKNQSMSFETINEALRLAINSKQELKVIKLLLKAATYEQVGGLKASMAIDLFRLHPNLQMLRLLEESGTDFKTAYIKNCGDNFLHLVSRCNRVNESGMIEFLIDAGCDVNAFNSNQETPLQVAMTFEHCHIAEELIDHGAQVNVINSDGTTPLVVACEMCQARIFKKLIDHGADLNYKDENGRTLLHLVADNPTGFEWLIERGADVNAKDKMGKTPLHNAMNEFVVKVLFDAGAHIDAIDNQGHTPFYESLCRQNSHLIEELLKCGADIRDPKVFKLMQLRVKQLPYFRLDNSRSQISRYLKRHLIKLTVAGFLDDTSYVPGEFETEEVKKFFKLCLLEVEQLKRFYVDDYTSLYKFLHKGRNRRCSYVKNEKLQALVGDTALEKKFPNYFVLILGFYNEAKTRKTFLEKSFDIFDKITKINCPYLCIDSIFEYLSNVDLLCFIEAGKSLGLSC